MASPSVAANAYASLARIVDPSGGAGKTGDAGGQSFASLLKNMLDNVMDAGRKSDTQAMAMASGKRKRIPLLARDARNGSPRRTGYGS